MCGTFHSRMRYECCYHASSVSRMFERELHDECKNRSVSQDYLITSNRQGNYWFVVLAAFGRIENPERPLEAQSLLNFIMAALIFPSPRQAPSSWRRLRL